MEQRCLSLVTIILFVLLGGVVAKPQASNDSLVVLFYNTENFFDCRDDSLKDDSEFLPTSLRAWHVGRFKHKAANVARVIVNSGRGDIPALVGLCEVENDYVVRYLTRYSPLKQLGYRYVMTESPDSRGIDVALLYQREMFRLLESVSIRFDTESVGHTPTRDALHCSGRLFTGDTLDVIVCHLPSRRNNSVQADKARRLVMDRIEKYADSLVMGRLKPSVLIMGDFNTPADDELLAEHFNNGKFHLLTSVYCGRSDFGSYKYQGIWQTIDHFVVNGRLFSADGLPESGTADIVDDDYLLIDDERFMGKKPFRTYNGMRYQGGYSDHLPLRTVIYY